MKLIFFLLGFTLILLRVYFKDQGLFSHNSRMVTITIQDGDQYTQLKYTGDITLSEDEKTFKSISPGGYFRFKKNGKKLLAEGNLQGRISYELSDDGAPVTDTFASRLLTIAAIHELIAYGFDAAPRMERVYQRGGPKALLAELKGFSYGSVRLQYARRLLSMDNLPADERNGAIDAVSSLFPDADKVILLKLVTGEQLSDMSTVQHYFEAIDQLKADIDKIRVLDHLLASDKLTNLALAHIKTVADNFRTEVDRQHIYDRLQAFE